MKDHRTIDLVYVDPSREPSARRTFPNKEACDDYCERMMIDRSFFTDEDIVKPME